MEDVLANSGMVVVDSRPPLFRVAECLLPASYMIPTLTVSEHTAISSQGCPIG